MLDLLVLEGRETPLSLLFDYTFDSFGYFTDSRRAEFESGVSGLLARISLPPQPPITRTDWRPFTVFGLAPRQDIPADTRLVFVGTADLDGSLAEGGPGGQSLSTGEPVRDWGGSVVFDPTAMVGYDLPTVGTHEVLHVLGVGHVDRPDALMAPTLAPGVKKPVTLADEDAMRSAGVTPAGDRIVFGIGETPDGWARIGCTGTDF